MKLDKRCYRRLQNGDICRYYTWDCYDSGDANFWGESNSHFKKRGLYM